MRHIKRPFPSSYIQSFKTFSRSNAHSGIQRRYKTLLQDQEFHELKKDLPVIIEETLTTGTPEDISAQHNRQLEKYREMAMNDRFIPPPWRRFGERHWREISRI